MAREPTDHANVFTIPPGAPFLDTLAAALLDGRLIEGFRPSEPFALADATLYLPTRRSARAIREVFLKRLGRPLLLPRIRTLGDIDEDEAGLLDSAAADIPNAVSAMERQLVLTELVLAWSGAEARKLAGLPDEELIVPASPADAARLAASLAQIMDQVGTEPEAWRGLLDAAPAELAGYWQITLEFLRIATEFWPQYLEERGLIDPGARRDLLIRAEAERLAREGSPSPVIAAGSTGSVPATAALLAAIAGLQNGAVVLPGLDQELDEESWQAIGESEREPAAAGHPQYGLKLLLDGFGVRRESVAPLATPAEPIEARARFVSEAMRPASTTERWSGAEALAEEIKRAAVKGIGILEATNEREEALAVAVILREAVETPESVAALVTPDRGLARRVAIELRRWGIDVDDSAGRPLGRTPAGIFARLVAETALGGVEAETLLALLKHPFAAFGRKPAETHRAAQSLERAILRGPRLNPGMAALRHALKTSRAARFAKAEDESRDYPSEAARGLFPSDWDEAETLAARVETALIAARSPPRRGWHGRSRDAGRSASRSAPCRGRRCGEPDGALCRRGRRGAVASLRVAHGKRCRRPGNPAGRISRPFRRVDRARGRQAKGRRRSARPYLGGAGSASAERRQGRARRTERGHVAGADAARRAALPPDARKALA